MHLRKWQIGKLSTTVEDPAQIFEKILARAGIPNEIRGGLSPDRDIQLVHQFVQMFANDRLRFRVPPEVFFDVLSEQCAVEFSPTGEARVHRQSGARQDAE